MISTFFSLEAAKRGLMAQMASIDVTGQNIANANTEGYHRQQAILTSLGPVNQGGTDVAESIGRGVEVQVVQQIKDNYLEAEITKQTSVNGYWDQKQELMNRIETLMLEPGDNGVRSLADKFWQSVEDLSSYPDDPSYRSAVVSAGSAFANGIRYVEEQLTFLSKNLDDQIREKVDKVNANIESIAKMNDELRRFESDSVNLNDLRDQRDLLVKEIAKDFDITVVDSDGVQGGRILLDGRILVDNRLFNKLSYENGLSDSSYPELKFANDKKAFTTDTQVASGHATQIAQEGTYKVQVQALATSMTVESQALVNRIQPGDKLSELDGIESGTFLVNGHEIKIDPTETTLSQFATILNDANAGVSAEVTQAGRLILRATETGKGQTITLADGSGNILRTLGLVAEVTGHADPPIVDPNASLNIGGWIKLDGLTVTIQQGKNDTLGRIAEEINAGVPNLQASVVTDKQGLQQLKIVNRDDPYAAITLEEDPTGNVLHRLGVLAVPMEPARIAGPDVTAGQDARFLVNGVEFSRGQNQVGDAVRGLTIDLRGQGNAEFYVNHLSETGEVTSLMSSRDELIPKYREMLFNYMKSFTDEFNRVHFDGFNAEGGTHVNFFTPMGDRLSNDPAKDPLLKVEVNPDLVDDAGLLATAGMDQSYFAETGLIRTGGLGDNQTVLALSALRYQAVSADGSTLADRYAAIFSDIGITSQTAKATQFTQTQIMTNLTSRREAVSGVSLDEEMTNLIRFQQAYGASARVINTINQMLDVLVNQLGK